MKQQRCWQRGGADNLKDSSAFCVVALGRSPHMTSLLRTERGMWSAILKGCSMNGDMSCKHACLQ